MKVNSTSAASGAAKTGAAKPAADGFFIASGPDEAAAKPQVAGLSGAGGVSGIGTLMALQGVGGPEARARALRKGRRILEALDRLQLALLGEGPTVGHLNLLARAVGERREGTDDPELDATLAWAEVRAAVEVAKLERTHQAA